MVVDPGDPFGDYYSEILRAEGLNEFASVSASSLNAATLAGHDVVVLASMTLSPAQVQTLTDWVGAGGDLIAMRPDPKLAPLLGLSATGSTLANAYLRIDTSAAPGAGITGATMQFHDRADRYTLAGASAVATLYSDATTATANPAVSLRRGSARAAARPRRSPTTSRARSSPRARATWRGRPEARRRDRPDPLGRPVLPSPTGSTSTRSRSRRPTSSSGCWRT